MKKQRPETNTETTKTTKKKKKVETEIRKESPLLDLSKSEAIKTTKAIRGGLSLAVINTASNGKRVQFSTGLKRELGDNIKAIQIRNMDGKIIIGANLDPNDKSYRFSPKVDKIIYSYPLVIAITDVLGLDYGTINENTGNKITTITLTNIKIRKATNTKGEVVKVAVIRRNKEQ